LADSGVENSDVLWIELIEEETPEELASVAKQDGMPAESHREDGPQSGFSTLVSSPSPKDRRGSLAPLRAPRLAIHEPSLVSSKGMVFILGKPPVIIGRQSQGIKPDIDLTDIDPEFISSRKHAEILLEDQGLVLKARKTTNGTFVNGVELRPSQKRILQNGDVIQFGFEGVELVFCSGPGASLPSSFFE
jgi:hypothetical protein